MRITQLLKKESVNLSGIATSKVDVLRQLADLMEKSGNLVDKENYLAQVMEREEQGSTGIGEGIAIPHAKTAAVHAPGLAAMIIPNGVDCDSLDGMPADLFFLIAAPEGGENIHLDVLSHLSRLLMDDKFKKSLLEATDVDEFLKIIDTAEQEKFGTEESATSEVHDKNMGGTAQPAQVGGAGQARQPDRVRRGGRRNPQGRPAARRPGRSRPGTGLAQPAVGPGAGLCLSPRAARPAP